MYILWNHRRSHDYRQPITLHRYRFLLKKSYILQYRDGQLNDDDDDGGGGTFPALFHNSIGSREGIRRESFVLTSRFDSQLQRTGSTIHLTTFKHETFIIRTERTVYLTLRLLNKSTLSLFTLCTSSRWQSPLLLLRCIQPCSAADFTRRRGLQRTWWIQYTCQCHFSYSATQDSVATTRETLHCRVSFYSTATTWNPNPNP